MLCDHQYSNSIHLFNPSCALPRPGNRRLRPWLSVSAKHCSVVGGPWGSLSGYGLPAFFIPLSCRAKGYIRQWGNRELYKQRDPKAFQRRWTKVSGRIARAGIHLADKQLWPKDFGLNSSSVNLSVNDLRGGPGCQISGSPGRQNRKSMKVKVVAEIALFRTSHARPADSAWKCPNGSNFAVGGTSVSQNPTTV